jgi:hypothetical protein
VRVHFMNAYCPKLFEAQTVWYKSFARHFH